MEFINLKAQYNALKPMIDKTLEGIMTDARFIGGKEVAELENKLAQFVGRKYCVSCANGTDALMLAFLAYGVREGYAVFCPDMTFIASIEPACMLGATPVFCDIDRETYNIDPVCLENAIEKTVAEGKLNPKAVVMVDFLGNPADVEEITRICSKYGLVLIEDAAQGIGAVYKGKRCGSFGDISTTSFFPSKPLGCYGDGGAVFTDSEEIAKLLNSLKTHGKGSSKYDNVRIGMNSRLDTVQAGVLLAKMTVLEEEMDKRQIIAQRYNEALKDVLEVPKIEENCKSAYAQYVLLAESYEQRDGIINALKNNDIPSLIYYPKEMHKMDVFEAYNNESFPNATKYAQCNFGIPFSPYLTDKEQEKVIETILNYFQKEG